MNFLKKGIMFLTLFLPSVYVFYLGFTIVNSKNSVPHLSHFFSILLGTTLMVISVVALFYIFKYDFCKPKENKKKSEYYYLEDEKSKI